MEIHERLGRLIDQRVGGNESEVGRRIGRDSQWVNNRALGKRKLKVEDLPLLAEGLQMDACDLACRLLRDHEAEQADTGHNDRETVPLARHLIAEGMMGMQRHAGALNAERLVDALRELLREYDRDHPREG